MTRVSAIVGLGVVAFAVTLAVYIGTHLSDEAISVLTGAACGVGAMLPAALVALMSLWRRREREQVHTPPAPPQSMYPPVIVVAPPTMNLPPASQSYMPPASMPAPRQFTVIGDDSMDST